ncbi:MAG: PadR family transcriptional regulator [Candidatus Hermodarchaeota archaeon]
MTETIKIQNLTRFYTLVLLKSKKSVTGYYIIKKLGSDLGKTASPTYIYDFLNKLQSEGYIKPVPTPKSKKSKGFQLTPAGIEFIDSILNRFGNLIEATIESKLKICASCGVKLYDDFHVETVNGKEMNFCCTHCAKAFKESHHA